MLSLLQVLFLLSSSLLVEGYGKTNDPNEEPFLPIYPVYPYSPKLIKRGADRDTAVTQLTPELYAPKVDAKDSYSASYSTNYPRDRSLLLQLQPLHEGFHSIQLLVLQFPAIHIPNRCLQWLRFILDTLSDALVLLFTGALLHCVP